MEKKQQAQGERWRLLTIGPSHYCEKARWALERGGLSFQEEAHLPPFHAIVNRRFGAGRTRPVLVTPHAVVDDSAAILLFLDPYVEPALRLYPEAPEQREEVIALASDFDKRLGPAVRRWLYFHLLPDGQMVGRLFGVSQDRWSQLRWSLFFPMMRAVMRKAMNIRRDKAEKDRERVFAIFDDVAQKLSDGRRYLVGDRLSAADLTFSALVAPAVLAPNYGTFLPPVEEVPAHLRLDLAALQEHPAGRFVLRLYQDERVPSKSPQHQGE